MIRRTSMAACAAASSIASVAVLAGTGATHAQDAGISGGVDSVMELTLEPSISGRKIAATVTATVSRTRLSTGERGDERILDDFAGPITGHKQLVRVEQPRGDDATITFGPQGP